MRSLLVILSLSLAAHAATIDGPLTPEQAIASFKIEPGLRVELVAAEPTVIDPVAMAFDEKGLLYVVEDRGYPLGPGKGLPGAGQVVLLESTKGDGHYDKRTVFADKLTFPNGVMPWKGGVYVTCAPYLYYFKDTNNDGVADIKQTIFKGFQDLSTTQLRVSHPTLNIDNWVYLTSGLTSAKVTSPLFPEHPEVYCNRTDFRFRPDLDQFEATAGTAQFGQTFDAFGHKFVCSNRNHNQHVVMQRRYMERNPHLDAEIVQDTPDHEPAARVFAISHNITTDASHTGYFTSACGVTIYDGDALPAKYRGNSFTCEPAGNLVHHDVLVESNVTFSAKRAYDDLEFFASPDNWCRPVNLANGPDGALYICDMYRKTIEHPQYLPKETIAITDWKSGRDMGRIYRLVAADHKSKPQKFDLTKASTKELCDLLENPNIWWSMTAHRLLLERQDKTAATILARLYKTSKSAKARAQSLWCLDGIGSLKESTIQLALKDSDPNVREQALLLAEPRLNANSALFAPALALATDPNPRVRFQCALTIGMVDDPQIIPALAKIMEQDFPSRWTGTGILSAVHDRGYDLIHTLLADKNNPTASAILIRLARLVGITETPEKITSLLNEIGTAKSDSDFAWQTSVLNGLTDGLSTRPYQQLKLMDLVKDQPVARERIEQVFKRSSEIALDDKQPASQRLVAIGLLAHSRSAETSAALGKLIVPSQPSDIQIAAVRALGRSATSEAIRELIAKDRWNSYTPTVRDAVVALTFPNSELVTILFDAIDKQEIPAWSVSPAHRDKLINHYNDPAISKRAVELFRGLRTNDRTKVYEDWKSVISLIPNSKNGHAIFTKTCSPCHKVEGEGKVVGPDLTGIRNQPKQTLLLHIIIPEYEIMPTYTLYNVETKDGESYGGLLASDSTGSITLRQAAGVEQKIPRANIATMTSSRLSLMPQELEKTMSRQDMADLLAFLKGE
ncbi:MAG: PVC-type heme-binding CxxCH protein [Limisphaerales bacterium]